jgi:hypothetical protein
MSLAPCTLAMHSQWPYRMPLCAGERGMGAASREGGRVGMSEHKQVSPRAPLRVFLL